MENNEPNRRRFFRIVDALGVSYKVMSEAEMAVSNDEGSAPSPFVDTCSIMKGYNEQLTQALEAVATKDPDTACAIEQINKKFDALLMMLELDSLISSKTCHKVEEASISASGIAFPVEETLEPETLLALDLVLRPSSKRISAVGRVVSCSPLSDGDLFYLRVDFNDMSKKDRETLIQHIVQRQGSLLRELREELVNADD